MSGRSLSSGGVPRNPTFGTVIATSALKLNSGAVFDLYNTADQTTNYERLRADYSSNVARIFTQFGGVGTAARNLRIGVANVAGSAAPNPYINISAAALPFVSVAGYSTGAAGTFIELQAGTLAGSAGTQTAVSVNPTINQSGTAGYTVLDINPTETTTGSGTKLLQRWAVGGVTQALIGNTGGLQANGAVLINGVSFGASLGASDVILAREAANTLALRNSTNAQTFRVYNNYTDASNYARLNIEAGASNTDITTSAAGTGVLRSLRLYTTGATNIEFGTNSVIRAYFNSSGHFLMNADNSYDIGASGASRPRAIYAAGSVVCNSILTNTTTVAGLGAAPANRSRLFVSDSTVAAAGNFGAIVAGGGANIVPVYSDGTNWRIG